MDTRGILYIVIYSNDIMLFCFGIHPDFEEEIDYDKKYGTLCTPKSGEVYRLIEAELTITKTGE